MDSHSYCPVRHVPTTNHTLSSLFISPSFFSPSLYSKDKGIAQAQPWRRMENGNKNYKK